MADNRYGGDRRREGWRDRDSSIFSDDDDRGDRGSGRWSGDYGRERGGRDDDRGFFERAGDEVRSWFGDDEAERRRELDTQREDARAAFGRDEDRDESGPGIRGGYGSTFTEYRGGSRSGLGSGGFERERGEYGGGSSGSGPSYDRDASSSYEGGRARAGQSGSVRQSFGGGRSQWDDNYRRWRDQQIDQFDREFDEFCRERQHQFDRDFDSWRTSRLTEGGSGAMSQTGGGSASGFSGESSRGNQGTFGDSSRPQGAESSGGTTAGGGLGSATQSSTPSTGAASGTGSTIGVGGESGGSGRGRGGRSRT